MFKKLSFSVILGVFLFMFSFPYSAFAVNQFKENRGAFGPVIFGFARLGDQFNINKIIMEMKEKYSDKNIVTNSSFLFMHENKRDCFSVEILDEINNGSSTKYLVGDIFTSPRNEKISGLKANGIYTYKQMINAAEKYKYTFKMEKEIYVYTDNEDQGDSIIVSANKDNRINYLNCYVADYEEGKNWADSVLKYLEKNNVFGGVKWRIDVPDNDTIIFRNPENNTIIEFSNVADDGCLHFIVKPVE